MPKWSWRGLMDKLIQHHSKVCGIILLSRCRRLVSIIHSDYTWNESGGGSGTAIDKVNSHVIWSALMTILHGRVAGGLNWGLALTRIFPMAALFNRVREPFSMGI